MHAVDQLAFAIHDVVDRARRACARRRRANPEIAVGITTGGAVGGMKYMFAFGLGTVPMLLAISLWGHKVQFTLRLRLQRLIPVGLAIVGALLVLRGLGLGIPGLSPKITTTGIPVCCHQ